MPGVKQFKPNLTTCLSTDFSKAGLGFILQQKNCKCTAVTPICCKVGWDLVLAGGRFNIPAEGRYSPTEGEALAIAVALENSSYYTLGYPTLCIATDHKPLLGILGDRALDTIDNPRLVRIKQRTLHWNYELIHVLGKLQVKTQASCNPQLNLWQHGRVEWCRWSHVSGRRQVQSSTTKPTNWCK